MILENIPFELAVRSRGSGAKGLPQSEWIVNGEYPVIGQGTDFIEGWTNRKDLLISPSPSLVLYGGHTRRAKYVDFPFVLGPNVKVLEAKDKSALDHRYLFYFLSRLQVKSRGYADHFPEVKRTSIPLQPINDQIRIANLLGKLEWLIAQRKQHLRQLDDLLKSVFLEMFGDPVRNEQGWEKNTAIDYADCIVPGRDKPKSFTGETPWVTTGDLQQLGYTAKSRSGIGLSDGEIKEVRARVIPKSSVLLTCVGDLGVVSICTKSMVINQQLHAFQVSEAMTEEFFMYSLSYQKRYMYQNASQTTLPYMNKTVCNRTPMIRPPKELQIKFAETVKDVHGIKSRYQRSLTDLKALFDALSQQAFNGELDLSRVPMPCIQAEEEKTVAAEPLYTPTEQSPAINLPDTDNLLAALKNAEARESLISQWLEAYRSQLGVTLFSVQHFMSAAQTRLAELHPENDFVLGANDYEHIKDWVFKALAAGTLTQAFDNTGNRIELKAERA